ncbi:PDR/VanB family oxidoreductase [Amycolatopsis sp. Poz14]|uniref:PDR/VanB family oxidoreductase n=1 Tax=Amycolatopsis sp. Poz14 TaxID=1447705 RepID=UPI001EE88733|nr:PDR/VanB family oxidoreductase [Amycolatopsis sp. Poz14]MCG3754022.1 oxidoreductase [Amycolatopsis sp. Poz14]
MDIRVEPEAGRTGPDREIEVRATRRETAAERVTVLTLRPLDGELLPRWEPGAHIDVLLPDGTARQYSLCGSPGDREVYRVGILREESGRGGSKHLHDKVEAGDVLRIRGPRNNFALDRSPRYQFIAGGIGITPLLPMIAAADRAGARWHLAYGGRSRSSMAFLNELSAYGDRVSVLPQDETGLLDLSALLGSARPDTLVYCCGPEPLLDAVERNCASWPAGSLRVERFAPKEFAEPVRAESFTVHLAQSGLTLTVPPERSVLSVVEEAGIDVLYSCSEGTCGTCETPVLEGEPDHRDSLLTEQERAANECMMLCVSRSLGPRLVLDL